MHPIRLSCSRMLGFSGLFIGFGLAVRRAAGNAFPPDICLLPGIFPNVPGALSETWWSPGWFWVAVLVGLAGLVFWLVERQARRVKRQQRAHGALTQRLIETEEAERKRIAAGLHDSLGQNLLVIKNRALLGLQQAGKDTRCSEQFGEISRIASLSLAEVREISHDLRPYQLDRLGLTKAMESMATGVCDAAGLRCAVDVKSLEHALTRSLEIHCYRIVQELLTNVLKHSGASKARVLAVQQDSKVLLRVEDDGCGFDWAEARASARGSGLTHVTERVRILGGTCHCDSQPAHGTRWTIELPKTALRDL